MVSQTVKNSLSYVPFQIFVADDAGWFSSTGTGFFYQLNDDLFIVTNWHVISGRTWPSGKVNTPSGRRPTKIGLKLASQSTPPDDYYFLATRDGPIFSDDKPKWLEHPELGWKCDLVAFPVGEIPQVVQQIHKPANLVSPESIPIEPGGTVLIIGYPKSISSGPGFPIYKSGYIASEPDFDARFDGATSMVGGMKDGMEIPAFFIDSLTREGMSGSPIFAAYSGWWDPDDPYGKFELKRSSRNGRAVQFIGCYSGRVTGERESDAALGLCWRESVIREICEARKPGTIWELSNQ